MNISTFRVLLMALGLGCAQILSAQTFDPALFEEMAPRNIGPAGMSGRVTSIDARHDDPRHIIIGTASGGVWKSTSGGINWKPIFDDQPTQSVGAVAIDQLNHDIVWAGTGEGNPRNSHNSGGGIYKSIDGGENWTLMGLENTKTIHRIIVHPRNSDVVYVAALGSAWGPNPERGVFKTTNGGTSWEKILYNNDTTGCADLVIDPKNPNKLIAAMWQYHREPYHFTSGGPGSGLYVTLDGGKTWKKRSEKNGLPKGELGRIGLGICHSQPNVIYALIESKDLAIYRSTDGGENWQRRGDKNAGNRPFYYADIYVDPINENRVYSLWSYVSRSEDGGKSFDVIADYGKQVHPDHHAFYIHPSDPDFLIDGNDGGLNISHDRGDNWRFVANLPLGQFYHINYDMDFPYNVYGGLQDNGSWVGPSRVYESGGIRNYHWNELMFGDGFDVVPVPGNSNYVYAMSQGGNVSLVDRSTGRSQTVKPIHPEGKPLRFNWNAAIAQSDHDSCRVFFGSQYLHRSTDCGNSWDLISPDLTTNDTNFQKQATSGGLTIDATKAENYTTIVSIAESPLRKGMIWVGTDDGNLQLTTNDGQSWDNLSKKLPGVKSGFWIPQIVASTHTEGEVFVVVNDYRRNDWTPYLFHSRDYGKSWRQIADSKQVDGYCLSIVQDPVVEDLLFLGTDRGLYVSLDHGANWTKWDEGYPSVPTRDLKIHPREGDLIIGTFGRSVWIMDDITPLRTLAKDGINLMDSSFHMFEMKDPHSSEWKPAASGRFFGQGEFSGSNLWTAARIPVWLKEPKENEKFQMVVFDQRGDTIRNWTIPADTGYNILTYNFIRNGPYRPSRQERDLERMPWGRQIMPGTYSVQVKYAEDSARQDFNYTFDPRHEYTPAELEAREAMAIQYETIVTQSTEAVDRLKEAEKTIKRVEGYISLAPDSISDTLKTLHSILRDSISDMMEVYFSPEDFVGYDHVTERLGDLSWRAQDLITSGFGAPGRNAQAALNNYREAVEEISARVNRFMDTNWKEYREMVEGIEVPLFEDI